MKIPVKLAMAGALATTLGLGSCSTTNEMLGRGTQTWTMNTSDKTPAAEGKVKVAEQKNGNTKVKVEVEHLAPADTISDQATTYVVWLRPPGGLPQNLGVLKIGDKRKGELETQTAFKTFDVLVTAESTANTTVPSPYNILTARVVIPT